MFLDFSQNNLKMTFEITDKNSVALKYLSTTENACSGEKSLRWCPVTEVHLSGENQDDHHGAKHTCTYGGLNLKYESHNYYETQDGNKLEFNLSTDKIKVVAHYQFYNDISAVRSWTTVTNVSKENIGLEYVSSFAYTGLPMEKATLIIPHNAWKREVNWKEYSLEDLGLDRNCSFSTKRINISNSGTWSAKEYLPLGAYSSGNGAIMWQIESNGSWNWEISDIGDMLYLKLSGPDERENHWYKELKPGESFDSVKCSIAVGESFNDALKEMTNYRRVIFENNVPNSKLPVIFNDYMHCIWADPTTEKMIPVIDKAAEAGAEYYCMDAGWYADGTWWETVGEWQPQQKRFPNGIKEVFDYIRNKGMIPGIWLEIEVMGINCPILDQFEDECFFMRHGKRVIDHGRYQLDFRNEKVREFATSVVDRVTDEYGVGYIKFDYNIDGGIGTETDADSFGDGLLGHNRAFLSWIDEVKKKHPDLIMENCASGGMRMDYASLSKSHIQSVTDQEDYFHTGYIAAAAPTAVLPEQAAIWTYPVKDSGSDEVIFNMTSPLLQRIHLGGEINKLSEKSFALVKDGIECYKSIRDDIPSSIPYFPAGIPKYGDGWLCTGLKCKNCTRISVWRMDSDENTFFIPLDAEAKDIRILYPTCSDAEINKTHNGISVVLERKRTAVLIEIS